MNRALTMRSRMPFVVASAVWLCWLTVTGGMAVTADEPKPTAVDLLKNLQAEVGLVKHDGRLMPQPLADQLQEGKGRFTVPYPVFQQSVGKPLVIAWECDDRDYKSESWLKPQRFTLAKVEQGVLGGSSDAWERKTEHWVESVYFYSIIQEQRDYLVSSRMSDSPLVTIDELLGQWDSGLYLHQEFTPILRALGQQQPESIGYRWYGTERFVISLRLDRKQARTVVQSLEDLCREKSIPFSFQLGNYDRHQLPLKYPLEVTVSETSDERKPNGLYIVLRTPLVPRKKAAEKE